MGRLGLALRAFFGVLFGSVPAAPLRDLLAGMDTETPVTATTQAAAEPRSQPIPPKGPQAAASQRSDAITLLAALQREARFVDLVQEPLQQYSDAQVGAAARDVLRNCQQLLARMFDLHAVSTAAENTEVETPASLQDGRWRVSGKLQGDPPFRGKLIHHGWEAHRCELPQWNGNAAGAQVVAPAEVQC